MRCATIAFSTWLCAVTRGAHNLKNNVRNRLWHQAVPSGRGAFDLGANQISTASLRRQIHVDHRDRSLWRRTVLCVRGILDHGNRHMTVHCGRGVYLVVVSTDSSWGKQRRSMRTRSNATPAGPAASLKSRRLHAPILLILLTHLLLRLPFLGVAVAACMTTPSLPPA